VKKKSEQKRGEKSRLTGIAHLTLQRADLGSRERRVLGMKIFPDIYSAPGDQCVSPGNCERNSFMFISVTLLPRTYS